MKNLRNQLIGLYQSKGFEVKITTIHDLETLESWQVMKVRYAGKLVGGHRFTLAGEMIE